MQCSKCGATVLKEDQFCKKCGAILREVHEVSDANRQVRSRFTLLFKLWLGPNGGHLKWLGYDNDKVKEYKAKYGMHYFDTVTDLMVPTTLFLGILKIIKAVIYHLIEFTAVAFGIKYKTDAYGNPVRYFKKK